MMGVFGLQSDNYAISSSCGAFSVTNEANRNTVIDITNLSATLKVSGNAFVWVGLVPGYNSDGVGDGAVRCSPNNQDTDNFFNLYLKRDATIIADFDLRARCTGGFMASNGFVKPYNASGGTFFALDRPAAGTYTWKAQVFYNRSSGSTSLGFGWVIRYCKLMVKELNF